MRHRHKDAVLLITLFLCATMAASARGEDRFVDDDVLSGQRKIINAQRSWHVTDDGLKRLRSYVLRGEVDIYMRNKVRRVVLDGTQITDKGLRHFAGRDGLVRLEELSLADTQVTDAGLISLSGLKHLRRVNFGRSFVFREGVSGTRVTAAGIRSLQKALPDCRIEHQRVPLKLSARQSKQFKLWSSVAELRLNDRGDIVTLLIRPGTTLTQTYRKSLPQLKQLSELHVGGVFSARDVARLAPLAGLRQLCLRNCRLDDEGVRPLGKLTGLRVLDLAGCRLTDRGLKTLKSLTRLTALNVQRTGVRTPGMQRLRKALPKTEFVFDPWRIVGLPYRTLKVNDRFELAELNGIGYRMPHKTLVKRLSQLLEHPSLERLSLRHAAVTDDDLKIVGQMVNLKVLDLGNTKITAAGLQHIEELERLEKLNLWHTKLRGDGGLTALENLQRLWSLELDETRIDDEALKSLARMPKLKYTELWHTSVTRAGVAALQKQRPKLKIRSNPRR
ncbi:MAG: hypothetical protein ACE5KM_16220 [Planctomycetaceae bacterium]